MADNAVTPVGVLERGLVILASFTAEHPRQKLHEIAERAGLDRATTSRALKTFVQFGYLLKSPDGSYSPGPAPLKLGALFTATSNIISRMQSPLDRISELTGQSAAFYTRSAGERICLARGAANRGMRSFLDIGATIELSKGGSAAFVLQAYTDQGFANAEKIKREGRYVSFGEMHHHMASVAVPVHDSMQAFLGAVSITGFKADLSVAQLEEFATLAIEELASAGFSSSL